MMQDRHQTNYGFFRSNIKYFKETDPDMKLKSRHLSLASNNSFIRNISSSRGIMSQGMYGQAVSLLHPLPNMIQSGTEIEMGKYVLTKQTETLVEVQSVVKRHINMGSKVMERLVIFKEIDTGILDCLDLPNFNKLHQYFGFKYNINDEVDFMSKGTILPKDTILAKPPTLEDDGSYSMGRDVNVALMPLGPNDEDGFIIGDETVKDFNFTLYETRVIEVNEDEFMIDIGNTDSYKPFMEVGETVREDGVIFGKRIFDAEYGPLLCSDKGLKKFNPIFDEMVYGRAGYKGIVKDIHVYKNRNRKRALSTGTTDLLDKYAESLVNFNKQIISSYEQINREHFKTFGKNIEVSERFNTLIVKAYGMVEADRPNSKIKKMYKLSKLGLYRIEVEIEYQMIPGMHYKFTDLSANKGVGVKVIPEKDMPVNERGIRAGIVMDITSTPSRQNDGRLYEHSIKGSMMEVQWIINDILKTHGINDIYNASEIIVKEVFTVAMDFIKITDTKLYDTYKETFDDNSIDIMKEVVDDILKNNLKIWLPSDNEKVGFEIIESTRGTKYKPFKSPVTFTLDGKTTTTLEPILIAPLYILLLSKIAGDVLTTSSAYVNHSGLPVVVSKSDKHSLPYRNSPTRVFGETEGRIIVAYGGVKLLAELKDLNSSLISHGLSYKHILEADKPSNIERIIDRSKQPYGTDRSLAILNTLYASVGVELKHIKDKNRIVDTSHANEAVEVIDIDEVTDTEELE